MLVTITNKINNDPAYLAEVMNLITELKKDTATENVLFRSSLFVKDTNAAAGRKIDKHIIRADDVEYSCLAELCHKINPIVTLRALILKQWNILSVPESSYTTFTSKASEPKFRKIFPELPNPAKYDDEYVYTKTLLDTAKKLGIHTHNYVSTRVNKLMHNKNNINASIMLYYYALSINYFPYNVHYENEFLEGFRQPIPQDILRKLQKPSATEYTQLIFSQIVINKESELSLQGIQELLEAAYSNDSIAKIFKITDKTLFRNEIFGKDLTGGLPAVYIHTGNADIFKEPEKYTKVIAYSCNVNKFFVHSPKLSDVTTTFKYLDNKVMSGEYKQLYVHDDIRTSERIDDALATIYENINIWKKYIKPENIREFVVKWLNNDMYVDVCVKILRILLKDIEIDISHMSYIAFCAFMNLSTNKAYELSMILNQLNMQYIEHNVIPYIISEKISGCIAPAHVINTSNVMRHSIDSVKLFNIPDMEKLSPEYSTIYVADKLSGILDESTDNLTDKLKEVINELTTSINR